MKNTQVNRLLNEYLDKPYGVTSTEALSRFSIGRLASRMWDIKSLGYKVEWVFEKSVNQFGEPISYKRYYIRSGNETRVD